jgi:arsenate reductase
LEEEGLYEAVLPQLLTAELAEGCSFLITMGCGEACPVVPGAQRLDWPLPDPKGRPPAEVREIAAKVREKVEALVEAEGWGLPTAPRR